MKKIILKTLITTFIISAVLGILIIILGLWNDVTGRILLTTITIFGFSIPGLACSTNYEKSDNKLVSTLGMITCFLSGVYLIMLIWEIINIDNYNSDLLWKLKLIPTCIMLSVSFGHICLLLLINSKEKTVYYFRNCTIVLSVIMDILILFMIFAEKELDWRLITIITILIALGTIVTPLLNKLNPKENISNNAINNPEEAKYVKLEQLKRLLDINAITQEEYETEKAKILNS